MGFSLIPAGGKEILEKLGICRPQAICDRIKVNGWTERQRFPLPLKYVEFLLLKHFPPAPQENHPIRNNNARLCRESYVTVYRRSSVCQVNSCFFCFFLKWPFLGRKFGFLSLPQSKKDGMTAGGNLFCKPAVNQPRCWQ